MSDLPIPLAVPAERRALAQMYIDLTAAFYDNIFPTDEVVPCKVDADLTVVAVAVLLGHAEGRPMNVSEIAERIRMPRPSTRRRLNRLIKRGLIQCIDLKYYVEPVRAATLPQRDRFNLILSKGFAVLGPYLAKMDT